MDEQQQGSDVADDEIEDLAEDVERDEETDSVADDDADELDESGAHGHGDVAPPAPRRGPGLGLALLAVGGGLWGLVALMRCGGPPAAPPLAMEDSSAPEPTQAGGDPTPESSDPTPASDEPLPKAADEDVEQPTEEPAEEEDVVGDASLAPRPPAAAWAQGLTPPRQVTYQIRRGGSLKNVANLFKVFHHEATALNPSVALDQQLAPNTKVVMYRRDEGDTCESIGFPSKGSLEGGIPMVDGPGRRLMAIPWKSWGTEETISLLDAVLRQWAKRKSDVQPVLVGNISARGGGRLEPHSTHQSGRDVDLGFIQKMRPGEEFNWREMTEDNLDAGETWALLGLLARTGQVEVIYVDRSIQKALYNYAKKNRLMGRKALAQWMEYPQSGGSGIMRHVPGHKDHLHVRFRCAKGDNRCRSR